MVIDYTLSYARQAQTEKKRRIMQTTYPLKIQAMRSRGKQPRFYVSFPLALAAAIGLEGGETVQWELLDRGELHLVRPVTPPPTTRRRMAKNPS
jgi:hypothetical protein